MKRFGGHLNNPRKKKPDYIGSLILNNKPASDNWDIEVRTFRECKDIVRQECPDEFERFLENLEKNDWNNKKDWKIVERAMIRHLKPCLNCFDNDNPTPIPPNIKINKETKLYLDDCERSREKKKQRSR